MALQTGGNAGMGQLGAPMPMPRINVGGGGPGGPQMRGAMPTMEATEVRNVDRGGLTGDRMLTFDISGSLLSAVEWDERVDRAVCSCL